MAGSVVTYAVSNRYERMLAALVDAAETSNTGFVHHSQALGSCFRRDATKIYFDCYLFLRDWRWRPTTASEHVAILVHAQETMNQNATTLEKSTVRVSYYADKENRLVPLHTVHFDYGPCQDCHPTFHAQLAGDPIILPASDRTELQCELEFPDEGKQIMCFPGARIPTSDMTLSSVLLCLAADHIGGAFFIEFRSKLNEIQKELPQPSFEELKKSLRDDSGHVRSLHWFTHTPVPA